MFRIECELEGPDAILRLSGRIEAKHIEELHAQIERGGRRIILDLAEVSLVDRDVVQFLQLCEARGIELCHLAPYIREWILRENARNQQSR